MDAMKALTTRRSVRQFMPDPIPRETIEAIVDAGRLAPTARNLQPWEFVVVTDAATRQALADINDYGKFIAQAPACIVLLGHATKYYLEDGCAATTNMLNAAAAQGLGACWVAGDKKPYAARIVELLGAPPDLHLVAQIALGRPAESPRPAKKRPLADVLHWETFSRK